MKGFISTRLEKICISDIRQIVLLIAAGFVIFSEGLKQIFCGLPFSHMGNFVIFALFVEILIRSVLLKCSSKKKIVFSFDVKILFIWILCFILIGTVSACFYKTRLILYAWSLRNYLRFFAFMIDCIFIFDVKSMKTLYTLFNGCLLVHIGITLFQFFVLGIRWDYLNGIFGTQMGGNSGVNALFLVNISLLLYMFYYKKINWFVVAINIAWMSINAGMNEIRVFFVEILVLLVVYLIFTRDYLRILKLSPTIVASIIVGIVITVSLYPYTAKMFQKAFSSFAEEKIEALVEEVSLEEVLIEEVGDVAAADDKAVVSFLSNISVPHHDNPDSLSRLTQVIGLTDSIQNYASYIRGDGKFAILLGIGLGNAEYATSSLLESDFFREHNRLWYYDFLLSFLYIETGILGLLAYNSLWVILFIFGIIAFRKKGRRYGLFMIMMSVSMMVVSVYDVTLRNNYGYLMWIGLAIPFILKKKEIAEEKEGIELVQAG